MDSHQTQVPLSRLAAVICAVLLMISAAEIDMAGARHAHGAAALRDMSGPLSAPISAPLRSGFVAPAPTITTDGAAGTVASVFAPPGAMGHSVAAMPQSLADWRPDLTEDFETGIGDAWHLFDGSDDGRERLWGVDDSRAASGARSAWVAAGGRDAVAPSAAGYPPNVYSWMITARPMDLRQVQAADVEFHMSYSTEPVHDWVFVGASVDGQAFHGAKWSGDSGGWQTVTLDLQPFLGYPEVYVAWVFRSDDSVSGAGVWVDDIAAWTYVESPSPEGTDLIDNGDFETGDLTSWAVPAGSTVIATEAENPVQGRYVAYFGGIADARESFHQTVAVPEGQVGRARVSFWLNQFGTETSAGADYFCGGIYGEDPSEAIVDFGCLDGIWSPSDTFDPVYWRRVDIDLTAEHWRAVQGQRVVVRFEMYTNGTRHTAVYVDDVRFTVAPAPTGGDRYEPNDCMADAKPMPLDTRVEGLTIDPHGDLDYFFVEARAGDRLIVDIDAAICGSRLDSVVTVLDSGGREVCRNDDDGSTVDSYVDCTLAGTGRHYVVVSSFSGAGGRSHSYAVLARLGREPEPTAPAPPTPHATQPAYPGPDDPTPEPDRPRTWTAMLYLDGDNNLCRYYPPLIRRMESELGSKIGPGGFLNVVVLLDRKLGFCDSDEATRYVVQSGGVYTEGVNRWNMGEVNMGDPRTLVSFARWAMQNYPAERYFLAIDNHGNGIGGIAWDDTSDGDHLTPDELHAALKEITNNGQTRIDLLAYEACLMGMWEHAYDVRQFADYLFFFPTISWANYAAYPSYFGNWRFDRNATGQTLGEIVADVYYEAVTGVPYVQSLVDLRQMDGLRHALSRWADAARSHVDADRTVLAQSRSAAQKVDTMPPWVLNDHDEYIDVWDLSMQMSRRGIAPAEGTALRAAIDSAVVRLGIRSDETVDYSNSHGLTLYWPLTPGGLFERYVGDQLFTSTRDGTWDEFLEAYFQGHRRSGLEYVPPRVDRGVVAPQPLAATAVAVSSVIDRWPAGRLIDGNPRTVWSSVGHTEHLAGAEWLVVQLAQRSELDTVRIVPRRDAYDRRMSLGFPKDFVLQYSYDGPQSTCNPADPRFTEASNWWPMMTRYGFAQPRFGVLEFRHQLVEAECVRLLGTELSQDDFGIRYMQIGEIALYRGEELRSPAGVVTSSALPDWPAGRLIDGLAHTVWSSVGHVEHLTSSEWAAVVLARTTSVSGVRIHPRADPDNRAESLGFPADFVIQYARDADGATCDPGDPRFDRPENWRPIVTRYGYNQPPAGPIEFGFAPRPADCVRLFASELSQDNYGNRYLQLAELEVLADGIAAEVERAAASSAIDTWPVSRLIDGNARTAWSSVWHGEHLRGAEWAAVLLAHGSLLGAVRLYPREDPANAGIALGFPKDFVLQTSIEGDGQTCDPGDPRFREASNWQPMITRSGFPQPSNRPVEFAVPPRRADCVRVHGTELSQDDYGNRYLQLAGIELLGSP